MREKEMQGSPKAESVDHLESKSISGDIELLDHEELMENVFNAIQDGISVLDTDLKIRMVNKTMENWYESNMPLIGKICYKAYHNHDQMCDGCPTVRAIESKKVEKEVVPGLPGSPVEWVESFSYPITDRSGKVTGVVEFVRDITERKRVEEGHLRIEALLNKSQAISHVGSWELDVIHDSLIWSDEVYRIFGLKPREFEATYEAFLESVHPDDRDAVNDAYSSSLAEGRDTYEIEHRIIQRNNGETRIVLEKCEHIKNSSGRVIRSVGMVQDITDRKRSEEIIKDAKANVEFYLDLFHHDIGNIHQGIYGSLQLIESHLLKEADGLNVSLDLALDAVKKAILLSREVKVLSHIKKEEKNLGSIDLKGTILDAADLVREAFPEKEIVFELDLCDHDLLAEPIIKQLFFNLFHNGIKFQEGNAWLGVTMSKIPDGIRVIVSDKGPGILEDKKDVMFSRQGQNGSGTRTGLGLLIVKELLDRYHGTIGIEDRVESDPSKGTNFIIEFCS